MDSQGPAAADRPTATDRLLPVVRNSFIVAGFGLVSYGAWSLHHAAGYLVAGSLLLVGGLVGALRA